MAAISCFCFKMTQMIQTFVGLLNLGVQAKTEELYPLALFAHCSNHVLKFGAISDVCIFFTVAENMSESFFLKYFC